MRLQSSTAALNMLMAKKRNHTDYEGNRRGNREARRLANKVIASFRLRSFELHRDYAGQVVQNDTSPAADKT
jgi:hypothetical protein